MGRLPNFFIIGAAKAGTTTLYDTLRQHPQVFLPVDKEPAFFCDDEYYARGAEWYVRTFFAGADERPARGEASSTYLHWSDKVVPRLEALYGRNMPRIIAIFRDPVSLVSSFYWYSVREGREPLSFRDALAAEPERLAADGDAMRRRGRIVHRYREIARYATHLEPFLERVPRSRCLFFLTEDLKDHLAVVRRLEAFLEVEPAPVIQPVASNAAAMPRSPLLHRMFRQRSWWKDAMKPFLPAPVRHRFKMAAIGANMRRFVPPPVDADLADDIRRHYADEVRRLEEMIGRDLSAWHAG